MRRLVEEIGIEKQAAAKIYSDHDESLLLSTIELTLQRDADNSLPPLRSRAAYFKDAIRGKYAKSAVKKTLPKPVIPITETLVDHESVARQEAALVAYDALAESDKDQRWQEFLESSLGAEQAFNRKRDSGLARKALGVWLVKQAKANKTPL
jgi:hypothetical protein